MDNICLQLFSVRNECEKDFKGTLKKVADMGYCSVEFAGHVGLSSAEMKTELKKNNLKAIGAHKSLEYLETSLDTEIEYAKEVGYDYIICSSTSMETREDAIAFANRLSEMAIKCTMQGLYLAYHNHAHEFQKDGDETLFDIMMEHSDSLLLLEIDVYWVAFAGFNPIDLLKKYAGRVPLLHLKDLGTDENNEKCNMILGKGTLPFPNIIAVANHLGTEHFIVDQDYCVESEFDTAKANLYYLEGI